MDYIEVTVSGYGDHDPDIIVAGLAGIGFESFQEQDLTLRAYIPGDQYNGAETKSCLSGIPGLKGLSWRTRQIPSRNWNALWESAYEPVVVAGKCRVRAPFHEPDPAFQYDLVIEPKMSFGTAHHETTSLMLGMMLEEDLAGKRVLDMGCGTAVLAILAHKMGAAGIVAIDNDEWAYANAPENAAANGAASIRVIMGDASAIPDMLFDLVVANINRNVLLADIPAYARALAPGGTLMLSGFFKTDIETIRPVAENAGLHYVRHRSANNWTAVKFTK